MKIKALIKKRIKPQKIETMTNDEYKRKCTTTLRTKLVHINKTYSDSLNEAGKFYVR
jgi:hypothetical protein